MNICLVSQQYPPETGRGGIGTQTATKARMLTELGHTVHVLSVTFDPGPELRTAEYDGVTVHRMQPPGVDFEINEDAPHWLGYAWLVFVHLRALEQRYAYDLINFPEFSGEGYVYQLDRAPWESWTPVAVQLHCPLMLLAEGMGWPEEGSDLYRIGGQMESETITLADGLLASSANIADFAARRYGVDRDTIDVVHCGVDLDVFTPGPPQQAEGPVVLFVGNVAAQKGVRVAFEAVMRLRARYPGIVLRIVGPRDGNELGRRIQREAAGAGAADVLEFVGFVSDRANLAEHYRRATVVCAPSEYEGGVANVYVEAMACGCPVVAADNGGTPEAVVDGATGFLVPAKDVGATAAALDRVLGDSGLRARLGEQGRRRVEGHFGAEQYIGRVLTAYERTIERSRLKLERLKALG
jgi:glycosyltransferase involved in cell wall biosynthesis